MSKQAKILLFGGTTEGKATANWLNDMGFRYCYSTKTPTKFKVHKGCEKIEGALARDRMEAFCREHQVSCVIDAAHPYAEELHWNINECCRSLGIRHIRVERSVPQKTEQKAVIYLASLNDMIRYCIENSFNRILSLMGVKSVGQLNKGLTGKQVWYRILDRELSWNEALEHGIERHKILASSALDNIDDSEELIVQQQIDALLTKDSGYNGLFDQKLELANKYGLPLLVLEQPPMPEFDCLVRCRADLRKYMETHYSIPNAELAHGYTSGTCATICAQAAATLLLDGKCHHEQSIALPDGELVTMPIHTSGKEETSAFATVIKNSGDDPDLMDGLVIGCRLRLNEGGDIRFVKGEGVGTVSLPGLQLPVGEPAINKVP
ncbi:MAG: precorrin-6A/cobalt-precorrin-6A reductase, partial [Bacteroidales bacterium]|nr:precorrin-6A/cobalt-precorrin-6A reductase [Bacteroidales bacterium]